MDNIFKIFILLLFSQINFGQCGQVRFSMQKEIDLAPKVYPACKAFDYIIISELNNDITNLDSLYFIKGLNRLWLSGNFNLRNIEGLKNIKKLNLLIFESFYNYKPFTHLDTINETLSFASRGDSLIDLSIFSNVKFIGDQLLLSYIMKYKNLGIFKSNDYFIMLLQFNSVNNDFENILPENKLNMLNLNLRSIKNLSTKHLEEVSNISRLYIENVSHCDFKELYNIPQIDTLIMIDQRDTLDYQQGFVNVKDLKRLELDKIKVGGDLVPLLPALEYVEEYISITNSSDIRNLDFLSKLRVSIPPPIKNPDPYLVIRNNPNLISCVNPFICKLLRTQPDYVILENNGTGCDRATILASCLSSTTDTGSDEDVMAYPNPFDQSLSIPSSDHLSLMVIYNTAGQRMELDYLAVDRLDTSTWPKGMYIVQYSHDNKLDYQKVVKQ